MAHKPLKAEHKVYKQKQKFHKPQRFYTHLTDDATCFEPNAQTVIAVNSQQQQQQHIALFEHNAYREDFLYT